MFRILEDNEYFLQYVIAILAVLFSIYFLRKVFKKYKGDKTVIKKRKEVEDKKISLFQKLQGLHKPLDNINSMCNLNGTELIKKISSGQIEPVDILEAYQANALIKNNDFNFISDIIYDADVHSLMIKRNDEKNLLGWPLSIKDAFLIEKYDCTQGLRSKIFRPNSKTCTVIEALKNEGAIPFIITNVSQGLIKMESSNPIFGKTLNLFNKNMTCGGSSGGEGVALGSESSLIGLGNDVRGDIRIPASHCGIYGLKPTSGRVSSRYSDKTFFCDLIIKLSIGPMARFIDDLVATFKAITSDYIFVADSYVPPVQFNDTLYLSKNPMKIGYYTHIGGCQIKPVPAIVRAVLMAKEALENAGHQVVELKLPNIDNMSLLISKIFNADGFEKLVSEGLKNGPVDRLLFFDIILYWIPRYIRYIVAIFCRIFSRRISNYILESSGLSVFELLKLNDETMSHKEEVLSMLEKEGIDGIICPVLPIVAPPINTCNKLMEVNIYCTVYNMIDYPAGSVPITVVSKDDIDKLNSSFKNMSCIEKKIWQFQKHSLGLPIGVQCVAKPWKEETCLRIMKDIVSNL